MGKRGGSGGGGTGDGKGSVGPDGSRTMDPIDNRKAVEDAADKNATPGAAADQLGLDGKDKEHFVNGANTTGKALDGAKSPEEAFKKFQLSVKAYERKYGRGAARVYSRGGYWSLIRFIKTAFAVGATITQVGSAPAMAAINASMMTAYWIDRATR